MKKNPDHIFDELLVLKSQAGDRDALGFLVKRWHQKLLRQANRHLFNTEISKDVVQECWQVIINGIDSLKEPSKFGVWALTITSRKSIDWIRKKQTSRNRVEDDKAAQIEYASEYENEKEDKLNAISEALLKLPTDQRIVLSMFYLESYSIADIASILSLPIGTIKSRLYHSREHLKKLIIN